MKSALIFALGALGLLAFANRHKSTAGARRVELPLEQPRRPRARRMRFRHRTPDGLLDLNSATLFELKELAGMAEDLAQRIVENRPYMTKIDLIGRRVIPDATYDIIKHSITVAHAA
ncbi:MAG: ComEA family DNA-binding protein [Terriglobales bacterium]|jgi:competence protein ComEA